MKPASHYRTANALAGLTRIDMLVALYDRALCHLGQIEAASESGDQSGQAMHEFKAQKIIAGLHAGLAENDNPLAGNLARLFEFCLHQIATGKTAPARRTLALLREAYASIREESNLLEAAGSIPPLTLTSSAFEVTV
jgi:flagellar secretion chaperone FliS